MFGKDFEMLGYRPSDANGGSNPQPVSRFLETLREVDDLLSKVEQMMVASHSHSPFNDYLTQLSDEQTKAMKDGIGELRTAMLCIVRHAGAMIDAPHVNTTWAIRRTLASVAEKLAEAAPLASMRVGERQSVNIVDPEKSVGQMKSVLKRLDSILG
jgi:hypothetical protein